MMGDKFLIWSEEHGAWWRPASRGYTQSLKDAGRYGEEAKAIVRSTNMGGEHFNELMIQVPEGLDDLMGKVTRR